MIDASSPNDCSRPFSFPAPFFLIKYFNNMQFYDEYRFRNLIWQNQHLPEGRVESKHVNWLFGVGIWLIVVLSCQIIPSQYCSLLDQQL
jgi:hypothetical protein